MTKMTDFFRVTHNIKTRARMGEAEDFWMARSGKELTNLYLNRTGDKNLTGSREDIDFVVDCARNMYFCGRA